MSFRTHHTWWQTFHFLCLWQRRGEAVVRAASKRLCDWIKASLQWDAAGPRALQRSHQPKPYACREKSSWRSDCAAIHLITRMSGWSPARHRGARACIQSLSNALCLSLLLSSGEPPSTRFSSKWNHARNFAAAVPEKLKYELDKHEP